jgi:hypothetical protein
VIHNYKEEEYRRKLTVKLKNAIMVYWLEVKKDRNKQSFEEIIKGLVEKKKAESLDQQAANEQKKRERKERRDRLRQEAIEKQKEAEAHLTSYINRDQFNILFDSIVDINKKISSHSETVDELERKLLDVNRKRKIRKEKQIQA